MTVELIRAWGRATGWCEVWAMWKCHLEATAVIIKLIKNMEFHQADRQFLFLPVFPAPRVRGSHRGWGSGAHGILQATWAWLAWPRTGPSPHLWPGGPGDLSPSPLLLEQLCGLSPSLSSEETLLSAELTPGGSVRENEHF